MFCVAGSRNVLMEVLDLPNTPICSGALEICHHESISCTLLVKLRPDRTQSHFTCMFFSCCHQRVNREQEAIAWALRGKGGGRGSHT